MSKSMPINDDLMFLLLPKAHQTLEMRQFLGTISTTALSESVRFHHRFGVLLVAKFYFPGTCEDLIFIAFRQSNESKAEARRKKALSVPLSKGNDD